MGAGFDEIGKRKNDNGDMLSDAVDGQDAADIPVLINNLVFCRNPQVLKDREMCLNLRNLI